MPSDERGVITGERVRYPGYGTLVGPTSDWRGSPPDAYVWTAYGLPDNEGRSERRQGFAPTRREARDDARRAFDALRGN